MVLCIVVGCGRKSGIHKAKFSKIPKIITNQGEEWEELTRERRNRWISAVSRGDTAKKNILESERVCDRHFVSGKPAATWDKHNIDWVPTLNLGKMEFTASEERAERAKERRKRAIERQELEVAQKRKHLNVSGDRIVDLHFTEANTSTSTEDVEEETGLGIANTPEMELSEPSCSTSCATSDAENKAEENVLEPSKDAETQTEEFAYMFYRPTYQAPDREYFRSDDKVRFYTGLPSYQILLATLNHVAPYVSRRTQTLDPFQEFIIVLMKLRLNVPFQDLAYRFLVSVATVSRIFWAWIIAMDYRLCKLVYWPERENLWKTMPMCFRYAFGNKVTVIIDCFEVFIEKPTNLLARAQTFSNYKHHNTIKVLIGITPQGSISFVSEAWGGRTSDKFLTENCGFLNKLLPGDMVMADRGFTISESVGLKQAELAIPAFTKGKAQLDPIDVEKTRGIANVRIHVERVIGLLRNKYTILEGTLPTDFLRGSANEPPNSQVPIIDRILRVCSALVNLCPPIVPYD
ncbi:uncharacterized protein [Montipora foliosa]|uniref:uncharacterized protein n=1 Tax=Montipora foliosa TaxID=591990 RepID=UPI0035F16058